MSKKPRVRLKHKSSVIEFPGITRLNIPADRVLRNALGQTDEVIVIGDSGEYFASSVANGATVLWMLERAKMRLLQVPDEDDW